MCGILNFPHLALIFHVCMTLLCCLRARSQGERMGFRVRCLHWLARHLAVRRQALHCPISPSVTSGSCITIKSCVWEGLLTVSCQTNVSGGDSFNVSNVSVGRGSWQTSPIAADPPQKKNSLSCIRCFSPFLLSICYVLVFKKLLDLRGEA